MREVTRAQLEAENAATALLLERLDLALFYILDTDIRGLTRLLLENPGLASYAHDGNRFPTLSDRLNSGDTLLHVACREGFTLAVELIVVECKANVNAQSREPYFEQPLHTAAVSNTEAIVDLLLGNGAESRIFNYERMTPFMCACRAGSLTSAKKILKLKLVEDIDAVDAHQRTALFFAAQSGLLEIVANLWQSGAKLIPTADGRSPLHAACSNNHVALIQFLINNGLALDEIDGSGVTPLHLLSSDEARYAAQTANIEWLAGGASVGRRLRQSTTVPQGQYNWFQPLNSPPYIECFDTVNNNDGPESGVFAQSKNAEDNYNHNNNNSSSSSSSSSRKGGLLSIDFAKETPQELASRLLRERAAASSQAVHQALLAAIEKRQEEREPALVRTVWPPVMKKREPWTDPNPPAKEKAYEAYIC